jgi:hypothetical protein
MDRAIELTTEYSIVSGAVRYDGDDGIEEQKRALRSLFSHCSKGAMSNTSRASVMEQECSTVSADEAETAAQGRGARIRHGSFDGRSYMNVDDFSEYFNECRASSNARDTDAIAERGTDSAAVTAKQSVSRRSVTLARVEQLAREWLCPDDRALRRTKVRVHLPLATIATFFVIAVSLMLLVAGSVMVATAKKEVSDLRYEVNSLASEAAVLEDKLESSIDYFEIYRVATEQYGMVDAGYVSASYLNREQENKLEAHTTQQDDTTGLATLLAAIGIRRAD